MDDLRFPDGEILLGKTIGTNLHRSRQFARKIHCERSFAAPHVDRPGQQQLAIFDEVDEDWLRALAKDRQVQCLAAIDDRIVHAHDERIDGRLALQSSVLRYGMSLIVPCGKRQFDDRALGLQLKSADSQLVGRQFLWKPRNGHMHIDTRLAVRVSRQNVDSIFLALNQFACFGDHLES